MEMKPIKVPKKCSNLLCLLDFKRKNNWHFSKKGKTEHAN